jgi:hypothetical protein
MKENLDALENRKGLGHLRVVYSEEPLGKRERGGGNIGV